MGNQSSRSSEEGKPDSPLSGEHVRTLMAIYIPGVENWQVGFLSRQHLVVPSPQDLHDALPEIGNIRCGHHVLQIQ